MKLRKIVAASLSVAMILGSSLSVLAADSVSGEGLVARGQMPADVTSVTLPTSTGVFNFMVDPEGWVSKADGKVFEIKNGKTTTTTSSGVMNTEGVYFTHSGGTTPAERFKSTSDDLKVEVKSYYDMDVIVKASVGDGGTMPLVEEESDLTKATIPSLALQMILTPWKSDGTTALKSDAVYIAGSSGTALVTVSGNPDKFETKPTGNPGVYTVTASDGLHLADGNHWGSATLKLKGKTTTGIAVPDSGLVVPSISYKFTIQRNYTKADGYKVYEGGDLWITDTQADENLSGNGKADLAIQYSKDGYIYNTYTGNWEVSDDGYVGLKWDDVKAVFGSDEATLAGYIGVVKGNTTRYVVSLEDWP